MKKTDKLNVHLNNDDDIQNHYDFDYSLAKPNRFAPILAEQQGDTKDLLDAMENDNDFMDIREYDRQRKENKI